MQNLFWPKSQTNGREALGGCIPIVARPKTKKVRLEYKEQQLFFSLKFFMSVTKTKARRPPNNQWLWGRVVAAWGRICVPKIVDVPNPILKSSCLKPTARPPFQRGSPSIFGVCKVISSQTHLSVELVVLLEAECPEFALPQVNCAEM